MWHGSWVLIWRRCHWVTTLLLMMILAYVTGTHTIILDHFWENLSSNSSTSSLFLSLFTFFFVARKAPSVALCHSFSIPPLLPCTDESCTWNNLALSSIFFQVKSPNIDHHWYPFCEAPLLFFPWDPETRVPTTTQPLSVNNIWVAGSIKCSLMA